MSLEISLPARDIPTGARVRKVLGVKEYTLVSSIKVYNNDNRLGSSPRCRVLIPERGYVFLTSGDSPQSISEEREDKVLLWLASEDEIATRLSRPCPNCGAI